MPSDLFRFRQFNLYHGEGYKIGTDAVLLGSWAGSDINIKRILDVGSGTGVVGFLLAQRFPSAEVHLLESNPAAIKECKASLAASPFADRMQIIEANFLKWKADQPYDLIVSNPPYFASILNSPNPTKSKAKHIPLEDQIKWFALLKECVHPKSGRMAIVLSNKHLKAQNNRPPDLSPFNLNRRLEVAHHPGKASSLVLLEYGKEAEEVQSKINIYNSDQSFSKEYIRLCTDFLPSVK